MNGLGWQDEMIMVVANDGIGPEVVKTHGLFTNTHWRTLIMGLNGCWSRYVPFRTKVH